MAATINEPRAIEVVRAERIEDKEVAEGMRIARYCTLDELPGLIFGALTVSYTVLSQSGLKPLTPA
jgi:hypothetical protein